MSAEGRSILGIVCCTRELGCKTAQAVMDRYVVAASADAVVLPALSGTSDPANSVARIDGATAWQALEPRRGSGWRRRRLRSVRRGDGRPMFGICRRKHRSAQTRPRRSTFWRSILRSMRLISSPPVSHAVSGRNGTSCCRSTTGGRFLSGSLLVDDVRGDVMPETGLVWVMAIPTGRRRRSWSRACTSLLAPGLMETFATVKRHEYEAHAAIVLRDDHLWYTDVV